MARNPAQSYKWRELKARSRRVAKSIGQRARGYWSQNAPTAVTFVAGVQRSGTNMLMNILDRSPDTDVYMEKDPRAFDEFAMRDLSTISNLVDRSPARNVVLKALLESGEVHELMSHFDNSKALWLYRHYEDMVNSYLVSWPGGRNRLEDIVQGADDSVWQAKSMTNDTLELVRRHYRPDLNDASALAMFWYYRNTLFFDQEFQNSKAVKLINYHHILRDPESQTREIADFLGIAMSPSMNSFISARPRRNRQSPDIEPPIRELCAELLTRLHEVQAHA